MNHENWRAYDNGDFKLIDFSTHEVTRTENPEETLNKFADFMENIYIKGY